jgi:hypothetical protein
MKIPKPSHFFIPMENGCYKDIVTGTVHDPRNNAHNLGNITEDIEKIRSAIKMKIERKTIGLSLSEKQKLEAIQHFLRQEGDAEYQNITHIYRVLMNYFYKNVVLKKTKKGELKK